jgi:hypothetical protein
MTTRTHNFHKKTIITIMKKTTVLLFLMTCLSWKESSAFLDVSMPQPAMNTILEHPFMVLPTMVNADTTSSVSVEAEVFAGLAHVGLDFTGMLSPSKSLIRLFAIVGRVFALSADYLPDHAIHPEELTIQLFFMCVSMRELLQEKFKRIKP